MILGQGELLVYYENVILVIAHWCLDSWSNSSLLCSANEYECTPGVCAKIDGMCLNRGHQTSASGDVCPGATEICGKTKIYLGLGSYKGKQ